MSHWPCLSGPDPPQAQGQCDGDERCDLLHLYSMPPTIVFSSASPHFIPLQPFPPSFPYMFYLRDTHWQGEMDTASSPLSPSPLPLLPLSSSFSFMPSTCPTSFTVPRKPHCLSDCVNNNLVLWWWWWIWTTKYGIIYSGDVFRNQLTEHRKYEAQPGMFTSQRALWGEWCKRVVHM